MVNSYRSNGGNRKAFGGNAPTVANEVPAFKMAYALALKVVKICEHLRSEKREYVLSKQLLRSGTSAGANLAESGGAVSGADLSNKIAIAYKECQETKYWVNLLVDSGYLSKASGAEIIASADEVARILYASMRTLRRKQSLPTDTDNIPARRGRLPINTEYTD